MFIDTESERALLCQMIMKPDIMMNMAISPSMFATLEYQRIYTAITEIVKEGHKPDILTISKRDNTLDVVTLAEITSTVGSAENWKAYEKMVIDAWKLRKLELLGKELTKMNTDCDGKMNAINQTISDLMGSDGTVPIIKMGSLVSDVISEFERKANGEEVSAIKTGVSKIDSQIYGFQDRLLYVIGARPSQGKSALALQMALNIAIDQKIPAGIITCESAGFELASRSIVSRGRINATGFKTGFVPKTQYAKIIETAGTIYDAPIYIWDEPNPNLDDVMIRARYMRKINGIRILFVDYAQIIRVTGAESRQQAAERVSMSMKKLARELGIPIVLLAQLKRPEEGKSRRPVVSDFQWSSQFEQDADVAGLLYHEYDENTGKIKYSSIIFAKVRDGSICEIPLRFEKEYVSFTDQVEAEMREDKKQ